MLKYKPLFINIHNLKVIKFHSKTRGLFWQTISLKCKYLKLPTNTWSDLNKYDFFHFEMFLYNIQWHTDLLYSNKRGNSQNLTHFWSDKDLLEKLPHPFLQTTFIVILPLYKQSKDEWLKSIRGSGFRVKEDKFPWSLEYYLWFTLGYCRSWFTSSGFSGFPKTLVYLGSSEKPDCISPSHGKHSFTVNINFLKFHFKRIIHLVYCPVLLNIVCICTVQLAQTD